MFSGDQRFTVNQPSPDEWNLKIEYATQKDSGTYECQVNTEPKIKLSVVLEVTGEDEKRKRKVSSFVCSFHTVLLHSFIQTHAHNFSSNSHLKKSFESLAN